MWSPQLAKSKKNLITVQVRTMKRTFSKNNPTTKCYKCQVYRCVVVNCPNPFKIDINNEGPIETHKLNSTISLKVTHVIKEFIVTRPFPYPGLMSTPPSSSPLLPIPTIITCFGHQSLSPLLPTPSPFLLCLILSTKSKFSRDLISITDQSRAIESALSFTSHVHEQPTEISDKFAQNNANHMIRADDRNRLNTFNFGVVQKLHACSSNPFQILMKLNDNIYVIDLSIDF